MWPRLRNALLMQRGHLLLWAPVALGIGIGIYFLLRSEPDVTALVLIFGAAGAAFGLGRYAVEACAPLIWGLGLIALGVGLGAVRARVVAAPVITWHYYGPIEGRVVHVDRSSRGALRVLLRDVTLEDVAPRRTPARVRVSFQSAPEQMRPMPGTRVSTTGHLSAPFPPTEPGGFDFRRHAWFQRLGATGYSRAPLEIEEQAPGGIAAVRQRLAQGIAARIGGPEGAFAAAITTGDRSAMAQDDLEALRRANLAHLLAISGLHMGLLTGFVFLALQQGGALVPGVALHWPLRKLSAIGAIAVGAVYLLLSGGAVSTERAFIMVAMMFVGVLFDRAALTLRAVALAALVVLIARPEAIVSAGFQMSFAATAALVGVFALLRRGRGRAGLGAAIGALFLSSLIAGLATAPFAAAHFNQVPHYGVIANMLSVPVMGSVVMPAAVAAALLEPFGLAAPALWVMKYGLMWILNVAHWVSAWPHAVSYVVAAPRVVLPMIGLGGIFWLLWQGRARWAGIAVILAGLGLWGIAPRPALLIAQSGGLVGVMTPGGRALTRPTGDGFAAANWLQRDGAPVPQPVAAARPAWQVEGRVFRTEIDGLRVVLVRGKTALAALSDCDGADLVITNMSDTARRPCRVLDADTLARSGAQALRLGQDGAGGLVSVRDSTGARPWTRPW